MVSSCNRLLKTIVSNDHLLSVLGLGISYRFSGIGVLWLLFDGGPGLATHSSTLAWKSPWTEEPGGLQSMGSLELDTTERLHFHFSLSCIGEGNGNPLQCSCLENPKDGGAWWAAVHGVVRVGHD